MKAPKTGKLLQKKPVYDEIKSFRLYRPGKVKRKRRKENGGWFRWLTSTGPTAKKSVTKFFAVLFSFATLVFFIGEGLSLAIVPDSAFELLTMFWLAYIGSNKAKDMISAARADYAPSEEVVD
ncbi:MAG: hypothetical protein GQ553_00290 [Nitrosomonadaceae bacterium]|nr:hypothetical protein [Nitrosomonadaceae bacterium]